MNNPNTQSDEKSQLIDPDVSRFVEELGLSNESSMLYGKCSALVRFDRSQPLPMRQLVDFAQATTDDEQDQAIEDKPFHIIDAKNDKNLKVGEQKGLTARSPFYAFTIGEIGGAGGKLLFLETKNKSRNGDLDLAVIEPFSSEKDHFLVGWKPDPLIGGGGRGGITTFLSCLVSKGVSGKLVEAIRVHPKYPYEIARVLYPHGFVPTAKPDEIRQILIEGQAGLSGGDLDAAVMKITDDLTRMKRWSLQTQLWFADLRGVTKWTYDTINPMGKLIKCP